MSIPLATTRIRVERASNIDDDPTVTTPTFTTVATDVRAVIGDPTGQETTVGGEQETVLTTLTCDPCDAAHYDEIVDQTTSVRYELVTVTEHPAGAALGLAHMTGTLRRVEGAAP